MADRTSIPVSQATRDVARAEKPESESWDKFISRAIESLQADSDEFIALDSGSVDDIATTTAQRTADELEARLR